MPIQPMLASLADAPLADPQLVYEPKYDGIRAIVETRPTVRLWSRLGNEKTNQFPEIASALAAWSKKARANVVLDGEIVALDANGEPTGFQALQGRIHLHNPSSPSSPSRPSSPVTTAFIAFDLLHDGTKDLCDRPLTERRAALERVFSKTGNPILRLSRQVRGDGRALHEEAMAQGWEGLIAKHAASLYKPGKRTPDWRKIKLHQEQEFVVGGWTEPRDTRSYFGALLLGVYSRPDCLTYVGHSGTGFNERELARVMTLLAARETGQSPFCERVKSNEKAHWVRPELVAQVRFTEWTADNKLRHPVYLGLRDDKRAGEVVREQGSKGSRGSKGSKGSKGSQGSKGSVVEQLSELEKARKDGTIALPDGDSLAVTNLHKVFWPKLKLTKGDLFRYYAAMAPYVLPVVNDRPLVMKRLPNGIDAPTFYQHRAPEPPAGVRVEDVKVAQARKQIVGGSLKTLLYTTQLAAISQDPWFSRVQHPQFADHAALDLDPPDGVPFERVLDVARWIHDELEALGATGWAKTSGADGLHIYLPLPKHTPYEAGQIFCQIIATVVAHKHPKVATVERTVAARGKRVYIDFLQNILGKTLASAYSVRASAYAGVSTPLSWNEVHEGVDRRDFTIRTVPARVAGTGDLWKGLLTAKGVNLERAARYVNTK